MKLHTNHAICTKTAFFQPEYSQIREITAVTNRHHPEHKIQHIKRVENYKFHSCQDAITTVSLFQGLLKCDTDCSS